MKLIRFLFFLTCLFCTTNSFAQTSDWVWGKGSMGGGGEGIAVCSDPSGNVCITGFFESPSLSFGSFVLNNAGPNTTEDIYIAKYDASGNLLWAKSAGGGSDDAGRSVSSDKAGNIYLTGYFKSSSITFGSITLNNLGNDDGFLVKYDASGNVVWAKLIGGNQDDLAFSVSVDVLDEVYVTGSFTSSAMVLGSFTLTNSSNTEDIFIAKYDVSGNVIWVKSAGGTSSDIPFSITSDPVGNVFITGFFKSPTLVFGSTVLTHIASCDVFVAKYDASGNPMWAKAAGGIYNDIGYSISADTAGDVYVSGGFEASISFGSYTLTGAGGTDVFIVKYDDLGNELWARSAGINAAEQGFGVSADPAGNVYLVGNMGDSITFSPLTFIAPSGFVDPMFVVKFDPNGNVICGAALASGGDDISAVSADYSGNAFVSGDYVCNPFLIGNDTLTLSAAGESIFVAKYSCASQLGVHELNSISEIEIFPNPTNGKFVIENAGGKIKKVEVYNVMGELIDEIQNQEQQIEIDLSSQSDGIYFICIKTENGMETKKVIVQK